MRLRIQVVPQKNNGRRSGGGRRRNQKPKMDAKRRGKRKSPSQEIIFEVSDNDISSENSEDDCNEPQAKISKIDGDSFTSSLNEISNLENSDSSFVEISIRQEVNCIELSEHISVSNSSYSGDSGGEGSDVIVITSEDNIDVLNNDSEDEYADPHLPPTDTPEEIIDITDENPIDSSTVSISDENAISTTEETPVSTTDNNPDTVQIEEDKVVSLEEFDDSKTESQPDEPIDVVGVENEELIDDTKPPSPVVEVENSEKAKGEDEVDSIRADQGGDSHIHITFSDEKMADLYKVKILNFLQQFVELDVEESEGLSMKIKSNTLLDSQEWVVVDETMCIEEVSELATVSEKPPSKKKKRKKNKKEKDLFVLDTNPSENEKSVLTKYSTKFQIDIQEKEKTKDQDEVKKISAQSCFNCSSNHAIKDCPLPKDYTKINAARQKFKAQRQTSRYHLEEDQKYSHLAPGKISDKLREALGLRKHQLPPFIYSMRILGYPPGWLEEAKFFHSNLAMFDTEGKDVQGSAKKTPGLDPARVVDYPGFNAPLDKSMKDEYRQYGVPPYSEEFNKEKMIEFFEKLHAKEQDDLETCDMDLDNTIEENQKSHVLELTGEPLVNPLLNDLKGVDAIMPSSPSLTDLENQKENLLAALEENSNSKSIEATAEEQETSDQEKPKTDSNLEKIPIDQTLEINIDKVEDSNTSFASPPLNNSVNCVKNSSFGTPILKSNSAYSQLPNPDNFMKDVSPVINFENLPNSTGKYEQMTGVLQKVRSTLKGMQNCKS
ncbi:hypothetical protein NQ315_013148 [Exocentrus adspersus]|uniref:PSP proline-rich domain-containing protein n=1 Tax=Exocentrus adspersus TaxID=1586481 RepID=A0AAV8VX56_9CUCU|nr:hypothetical protein NQ315_013148 [Exocentrus adspersus]